VRLEVGAIQTLSPAALTVFQFQPGAIRRVEMHDKLAAAVQLFQFQPGAIRS